jgi:3-oxo-5alpha-steroid 4-dehydrogenase
MLTSLPPIAATTPTTRPFASNKQMIAAHCPQFLGCAANLGTPGDDGSGIRMGQAVGADTRMMGMAAGFKVITGSATVKGILVNQQGVRYMAEDHYFSWPADAIIRTYPISYLILDGGIWKELGEAGQKAAVVVQKADTLADLGKALKMVPGLLENTVNFYNQGAAKSQDPQFGKFKDYMQTLMTPPYYALDASAKGIVFFTTGGLRTNLKAQVLDASGASAGRPIPGLYAAGRNAFGLIGYRYQGSGSSVADALTFGRIAGQNAAAEKPGV